MDVCISNDIDTLYSSFTQKFNTLFERVKNIKTCTYPLKSRFVLKKLVLRQKSFRHFTNINI
jgi:hypothetical protein